MRAIVSPVLLCGSYLTDLLICSREFVFSVLQRFMGCAARLTFREALRRAFPAELPPSRVQRLRAGHTAALFSGDGALASLLHRLVF